MYKYKKTEMFDETTIIHDVESETVQGLYNAMVLLNPYPVEEEFELEDEEVKH